MFPKLVNRFRGAAVAAAMGWLALLGACASTTVLTASSPELSGVRVETGADATRVVLLGAAGSQPTAVQEQDPARIVVDLPAGVAASAEGATPVWDGTLEEVTVSREGSGDALSSSSLISSLVLPFPNHFIDANHPHQPSSLCNSPRPRLQVVD